MSNSTEQEHEVAKTEEKIILGEEGKGSVRLGGKMGRRVTQVSE